MSFRRKRSGPVPVLGAHLEDLALVGDPLDEKIKAVDEAIKGAAKRVKELRKKLENQATNPALEKQLNDANKKIERIEKERLAAIAKLDGPEQEAKAIAYVNYEKKNADLLKTISKLRDEVAAAAKPDGELQVAAAAKPDDEILADAPQVPTKPVKKTKKKPSLAQKPVVTQINVRPSSQKPAKRTHKSKAARPGANW